ANSLYAIEQRRQIGEIRLNVPGHVTADTIEFFGQRFDDGVDAFSGCRRRLGQPVEFGDEHGDQLTTACDQSREGLPLCARQRFDVLVAFRTTFNDFAELRENAASMRSVFASYPIARAKSRACQGLMTATA
uniref:hypothetical protein n=1 Tax=Paraburkholderia rhynchosiae TaxID=487049 RepID=UPI0015829504